MRCLTGMDTTSYLPDLLWTHSGRVNPSAADTGKPWTAPRDLTLDALILTLESASDIPLSVDTAIDGAVQRTNTIEPGAHCVSHPLGIAVAAGTTLHPTLLAATDGTGIGLWIVYRCSPA